MQTFRLFVSSPGDVMVERRRVENVASRLNGEFAGIARFEVIRWETQNYQAFSTFQDQIPRSVDCDLVIGILKWRLGTELPPNFSEKLPDGQSFPSGTAYEILSAIEKRQKGLELPDVYIFRFTGSSPAVAIEDPDRDRIERDWQTLKAFFQDWFQTAQGHFKAAFNPYASEDDFESQLEKLLRNWMAEKVAGGRSVRWPIEVRGSPFCGLAAFGARHAPVFFGRNHDIARAVDLWREAGDRRSPYLLVIGASGSGKSSLARAGLLPRLTTPGVVREVDLWRIAVMRPSDSPLGPFAALAAALMQSEAGLSKEEDGRGAALPEIALGDSRTPADLASVLRHADSSAIRPIVNALESVARLESDRGNYARDVRCDLVLLIDQLDELFAASVSDADRDAFLNLVAAMVATGRIWVVATLRADLYPRMLEQQALKKLKEGGATYDLAPPGAVELAEIVRSPAEAAGLVYEMDAASGERLDARLLRDAERQDMLPLVQLALSRLFEGRHQVGDELRLPLAVYRDLGGLTGIINEAGERAIASVGEQEKTRLPRLLRQLAVAAHDSSLTMGDALTVRAVPLAQAAPDPATRALIDALVTARLLTVHGNPNYSTEAQVRLTHQRVLEDWSRARAIVAESADFYRVRSDLEESYRKWNSGGRRRELLLARGLPLAEAEKVAGGYGDELSPEIQSFIQSSGRRARLSQQLTAAAAILFAILTMGASILGYYAVRSERRATQQFARAERTNTEIKQAFDQLLSELLDQLNGKSKKPIGLTLQLALESAKKTLTVAADPNDMESQQHLAEVIRKTAALRSLQADDKGNLAAQQEIVVISRRLVAADPANRERLRDLGRDLSTLGMARSSLADEPGAMAAYRESEAVARKLTGLDPQNLQWQGDLAEALSWVGDLLAKEGDTPGALAKQQEALAIASKLAVAEPANKDWYYKLSRAAFSVTRLQSEGDHAAKIATDERLVTLYRSLSSHGVDWQRDLASWLGFLSYDLEDPKAALAALKESVSIKRRLPPLERKGLAGLDDHGRSDLSRIATLELANNNREAALAAYREIEIIDRKAISDDPGDADEQTNLVSTLVALSDIVTREEAVATLNEALKIVETLDSKGKLETVLLDWPNMIRERLAKLQ